MGLKNSSVILLLSMAFLSCNNGSSNSETANETKSDYKEGYNFIELNRCKTAPHDFKANSAEAVKKLLCEALQDPEINNNCAEDQRKIYFDQKCSGYTWTPSKKEPKDPVVVVPPVNNLEVESRSLLRDILVSDAEVSAALDTESLKKVQVLAQDLIQCGLSFVRPRCLDYDFTNTSFPVRFYTENGLNFFVSEMILPDWSSNVLFVFKILEKPELSSNELYIFKKIKPKLENQTVLQYLDDEKSVLPMAKVNIITKALYSATWEKMKTPGTLKQMYHLAYLLWTLENRKETVGEKGIKKYLTENILNNKTLFSKANDLDYVNAVYFFIESFINPEKSVLIDVAAELLKADDFEIKEFAAVQLFSLDNSRADLRSQVLHALNSQNPRIRIQAINALAETKLTLSETEALLLKMEDENYNVRFAAGLVASKFSLTDKEIGALEKLQDSQYSDTRIKAAMLIGRIPSSKATTALIIKMSDENYNVRQAIYSELGKRTMTEAHRTDLAAELKSKYVDVRIMAAKFMSAIDSEMANKMLITFMSDEDYNVRRAIGDLLKNKSLNDFHLGELKSQIVSEFIDVRITTTKLLGKMATEKSIKLLIQRMSDEDYNVRMAINDQLRNLDMNDAYLSELRTQLDGEFVDVKINAAILIGKLDSIEAIRLLIKHVSGENYNVRTNLFKIIDKKTMQKDFVAYLKIQFSSEFADVRIFIANQLGKIVAKESVKALESQLQSEADYNVQEAIKTAIKSAGG